MKFLDLFSGIGGFRLGLEQHGHECVGHVEIDEAANRTYKAMHQPKESEFFGTDITRIIASDLPRADIWTFGFPCQDISIAGRKVGMDGERSGLFYAVTSIIREIETEDRPRILFIENVKNLLSINGGWDFTKLIIELDEIGYDAEWEVINSKHHGVPQNRERLYIVGHLRGTEARSVFPIQKSTNGILKSVQADTSGKGMKSQQDRFYLSDGIMCCLPKARAKTKCCVADREGNLHILTGKERFRLQGFPDEYIDRAMAVSNEVDMSEQAGNSVTVNVIAAIAERFE